MHLTLPPIARACGFDRLPRRLLYLSVVSSLVYLLAQTWRPLPGSIVFKALSLAPLAVLAGLAARVGAPPRRDSLLLAAALGCSCVGDVLLDLTGERFFEQGLFSFLIAHLIYIVLFLRHRPRPFRLSAARLAALALLLPVNLTLMALLAPRLGHLQLPVLIYTCVITAMVAAATIARFKRPWIVLGAVLFLLSDSLIAVHEFMTPVAGRNFLVWATYYLGQCAIALGLLYEKAE